MKKKIVLSVSGTVLSLMLLILVKIFSELQIISQTNTTIFIVISAILLCISIVYLTKLDYETGVYECKKCGQIFKPELKDYISGMHTLRKRYLKCPECKVKTWCTRKNMK